MEDPFVVLKCGLMVCTVLLDGHFGSPVARGGRTPDVTGSSYVIQKCVCVGDWVERGRQGEEGAGRLWMG